MESVRCRKRVTLFFNIEKEDNMGMIKSLVFHLVVVLLQAPKELRAEQ